MVEFISDIIKSYPFVAAVAAMCIAQGIKLSYYFYGERRINFRHLLRAGGMPSAHSALVVSLATAIGLQEGWGSTLFIMALIFAGIVMYDAAGVRQAAGKQAKVLNRIVDEIFKTGKISEGSLLELIGHTPMEVIVGATLGLITAFLLYKKLF